MPDRVVVLQLAGECVLETRHMRLCGLCARGEYWTYHDRRFVRLTYFDGAPVLHK